MAEDAIAKKYWATVLDAYDRMTAYERAAYEKKMLESATIEVWSGEPPELGEQPTGTLLFYGSMAEKPTGVPTFKGFADPATPENEPIED